MPILQSRILALIDAAGEYESAFESLARIAQDYGEQLIRGEISTRDFSALISQAKQSLTPKLESIRALAKEKEHFRHAASRNAYSAKRLAKRRRGESPEPTATRGQFQKKPPPDADIRQPLPVSIPHAAPAASMIDEITEAQAVIFREESQRVRDRLRSSTYVDEPEVEMIPQDAGDTYAEPLDDEEEDLL